MGNRQTAGPSLGEASKNYRIPSEQARQKSLRQKELATTLQNDGWAGVNQKSTALSSLKKGTNIPAAYQVDDNGEIQTTHAIERNPATYEHIFSKAQQDALARQLQCDEYSEEELVFMHIFFIQQAIDTLLRPQAQTEGNMHRLVEEMNESGETTISTADIKAREAEVCTMKSMIAQHYLQENCPGADVTMLSETAYKGGNEGHNYLEIQQGGTTHEYHANSPHNGLPTITGLSDAQKALLEELQEMKNKKEKNTPSMQITYIRPSSYRVAA